MTRESRTHREHPDLLFREEFLSEQEVRRNGGNPNAGATNVTFTDGCAILDGLTAFVEYPRGMLKICQPERAFSIRTRVYLTDTDASVFMQMYLSGANLSHEFRFMIGGNFPVAANNDKLVLELWDSSNDSATEEVRGRRYDTALTTIARDRWVEFVAVYDGRGGPSPEDGICLFMDGVAVDDTDFSYSPGAGAYTDMKYHSDLTLRVGQNVEGKMDFIEVWNYVLTPSEIWNMYS